MTSRNLPPGCTDADVDRAMGEGDSDPCTYCNVNRDDLMNELEHPTNSFYLEIKGLNKGCSYDAYLCESCTKTLLTEILETL